jgi:anti-sigma regulatory factor (Ser/Thr protein kinase)
VAEAVAADRPVPGRVPGGSPVPLSRIATLPVGGSHGWRLPATPISVPTMRRSLRAVLAESGLREEELYDLLLAACEAATNAIEHAQQPTVPYVDVLVDVMDGQVVIVVRDHGRWRDGPPTPHRGRGLSLMRDLADTAVDPLPNGTTVTIRSRSAADRPSAGEPATG